MLRCCCQTSRLEVGIKTKLNARLPIRQRVDLFEGNVSANKISLPQGQNCTLSITLLYNYLPVYHTIYCSHFINCYVNLNSNLRSFYSILFQCSSGSEKG